MVIAPEPLATNAARPALPPLKLSRDKEETSSDEKLRLQEMVKAFTKRALQGVKCGFVDTETGQVMAATYRVDRRLHQFIVKVEGEREVGCVFERIKDVLTVEDGEHQFPPQALQSLTEGERARLLMILHDERPQRLCLLEANALDKETFHTCMGILRLYAQQQQDGPSSQAK